MTDHNRGDHVWVAFRGTVYGPVIHDGRVTGYRVDVDGFRTIVPAAKVNQVGDMTALIKGGS